MKRKSFFVIGAFILSIIFLTASAYAQLGTPTCVSPKLAYGQAGTYYYSPRTPTFSWTPVTDAVWYQVWISEAATPDTAVILQWVENGTSWTLGSYRELSPGTQYSWWVAAWNETHGSGPWSARADFTAGKRRYLSINANDFVPHSDGYDYSRYHAGGGLHPNNATSNYWCAPVNLPHGAKVSDVTFFYDNNGAVGTASTCHLYRSQHISTTSREEMGNITAGTGDGESCLTDTSISNDTIDNWIYSYFLRVDLPSSNNWLIDVHITYWD